jgi:hypothetical protein
LNEDDRVTSRHFDNMDCLALVERSPAAVAVHDKAAWLALFARYNVVEDPVGSAPHITGIHDARTGYRGSDSLDRFYDTFIAPNAIRFHVDRDIVNGLHVVRDLTIEIAMSARLTVRVPAHLLYELMVEGDELKIFRLAAHWELASMLRQQLASGWPFLAVGWSSTARLLRYQGPRGMAGFMRALSGVGAEGKSQVERFARYFNDENTIALESLFTGPDIRIAFPHAGGEFSIAQCAAQGGQMQFTKVLAAGNVMSATLDYQTADARRSGVAIFELDSRSRRIVALSFYWA